MISGFGLSFKLKLGEKKPTLFSIRFLKVPLREFVKSVIIHLCPKCLLPTCSVSKQVKLFRNLRRWRILPKTGIAVFLINGNILSFRLRIIIFKAMWPNYVRQAQAWIELICHILTRIQNVAGSKSFSRRSWEEFCEITWSRHCTCHKKITAKSIAT